MLVLDVFQGNERHATFLLGRNAIEMSKLTAACRRKPLQQSERTLIRLSFEILIEHPKENRVGFRDIGEESHTRAQFQIIGVTKDLCRRFFLDCQKSLAAFNQALPEQRMLQVGLRLIFALDGVELGRRAVSQAVDLRKYEPHPMTSLLAAPYLGQGSLINFFLRLNKPIQAKPIMRGIDHMEIYASEGRRAQLPTSPRDPTCIQRVAFACLIQTGSCTIVALILTLHAGASAFGPVVSV